MLASRNHGTSLQPICFQFELPNLLSLAIRTFGSEVTQLTEDIDFPMPYGRARPTLSVRSREWPFPANADCFLGKKTLIASDVTHANYLNHRDCTELSCRELLMLCMNTRYDNNDEALVTSDVTDTLRNMSIASCSSAYVRFRAAL
jgi:hypothetical protein